MSARFGFADFEIDPDEGKLTRRGYTVSIQDQPFRLLTLLVSRAGVVVTRDEIRAHLWPENTYIEFDKSLRVAVSKLREALRDSSSQPEFVETLPRRGYRFIAPVTDLAPQPDLNPQAIPYDEDRPPIEVSEASVGASEGQTQSSFQSSSAGLAEARSLASLPTLRIGIAALVIAVLVCVPLYLFRSRAKSMLSPAVAANPLARRSVAVIGLRNLGGSAQDAWLSTALTEMLSNELSASDHLRVVSGEEVARAGLAAAPPNTPSPQSLAQFGSKLGADMIVFGSYTVYREQGSSAPRLRLDLRVEDLSSDAAPITLVESGNRSDLFALVSSGGSELRNRFRLKGLSADAAVAVRKTLPENAQATELYSKGLDRLRNFDPRGAKELLEEAAKIEPGHAGTHLALAEAWRAMGYENQARDEAALAVKMSAGLPREETLSMQAELALLSSDWSRAADSFRSLEVFYPDNIEYALRLAQAQSNQSDPAGALVTLNNIRRADISRADAARIDLSIAQMQLQVSEFQQALAAADRAIDAGKSLDLKLVQGRGLWIKASSLERLGKDQESLAASSESQAIYRAAGDKQGLGIALMMSGDVLYDMGKTSEARSDFEESLRLFREIGQRQHMGLVFERIGNSYFDEGKLTESGQNYKEALAAYNDVRWDAGVGSAIGNLANVQDTQGDIAGALESNQRALVLFEQTGDKRGAASTLDNIGNLELEKGALDRAADDFNRAGEVYRQIAYPRGLAYSFVGQGDVLLARDDLAGAVRKYDQAGKAIEGMDEPSELVMVKTSLGVAALEQGNADQAAASMQQALSLSAKEANHGALAREYAWLSRCFLRRMRTSDALAAARHSVSEARLQAGPQLRLVANLALERAEIAGGDSATANAEILASVATAKKYGYGPLELELRILLAETETKQSSRHRLLEELSREASKKGWILLASDAGKTT